MKVLQKAEEFHQVVDYARGRIVPSSFVKVEFRTVQGWRILFTSLLLSEKSDMSENKKIKWTYWVQYGSNFVLIRYGDM